MMRPILKMGDPLLPCIARPVIDFADPKLSKRIADMYEMMAAATGVGLAARQIGVELRVMVFGFDDNPRYPNELPVPTTTLINPQVTIVTDETEDGWEGCLSIPGLRGLVPRPTHIHYCGVDEDGSELVREDRGFHARVVHTRSIT